MPGKSGRATDLGVVGKRYGMNINHVVKSLVLPKVVIFGCEMARCETIEPLNFDLAVFGGQLGTKGGASSGVLEF